MIMLNGIVKEVDCFSKLLPVSPDYLMACLLWQILDTCQTYFYLLFCAAFANLGICCKFVLLNEFFK